MIYKFNTGLPELDSAALELYVDVDQVILEAKISDPDLPDQCTSQTHYLDNHDIDNFILALTEMKREIAENKRTMNR